MKRIKIVILFILILLSYNCRSTRFHPNRNIFVFHFEVQRYEILSTSADTKSGYNMLIQRENQHFVLRAIDSNQDGILDSLMNGNITLKNANEIYIAGIQKANSRGSLKKQEHKRIYRSPGYTRSYVLETFHLFTGEIYNKLTITDYLTDRQIVVIDINADGVLDKIDKENGDPKVYQGHYEKVIASGIRDGEIDNKNNLYLVKSK